MMLNAVIINQLLSVRIHFKPVQMHHENGHIFLFYTISVMRYLKPFGFYLMSLSVFAPMLCVKSNFLHVVSKTDHLKTPGQVAKQRIHLWLCAVLIYSGFLIVDVCWFLIRGF